LNSVKRGSRCPYCAGHKPVPGVNDLATLHPDLAAQWGPDNKIRADECGPRSSTSRQWVDEHGHVWWASPYNRVRTNGGCPVCAGRVVEPGVNDLATLYPELAAQWGPDNDTTPDKVTAYTTKPPRQWVCEHGHTWWAAVVRRTRRGNGCTVCSGHGVQTGVNDLATLFPALMDEWDYTRNAHLDPTHLAKGSSEIAWWTCSRGHSWQAIIYNRTALSGNRGCPKCANAAQASRGEMEVADYLRSLGLEVQTSVCGVLPGKLELDIVVPDKHLAVQFNGIYWHSEAVRGPRDHQVKQQAAEDAGLQLITVWEDDWRDRRDVVEQMLAHKAGVDHRPRIGARSCTVDETVSLAESSALLEAHHIQGAVAAASHRFGLRAPSGELVAVMVLRSTGKTWTLVRYATAVNVPGGFTRLLSHARRAAREAGVPTIATFSDATVSDGGLYRGSGFTEAAHLPPSYMYLAGSPTRRVHRFRYRKDRFRRDPDLQFVEGETEAQLAARNGLLRVWDAGKTRWELTV
jgi:G:T-mismatch repair DNA endonuclease (very short patch repair protein)